MSIFGPRGLPRFEVLAGPAGEDDAATRAYVEALGGRCLLRDGSNPPTRAISMGGHRLTQLAPPSHQGDAVSRGFMDSVVSPQYYYRLRFVLTTTGLAIGKFFIPNRGRFTSSDEVFVVLSPLRTPTVVCLYDVKVDENYLLLQVGVKHKKRGPTPPLEPILINAAITVTRVEIVMARPS